MIQVAKKEVSLSNVQNGSDSPLARMLKRIRRSDDFPGISKYMMEINKKLSANPDTSDASELANVILNDYALTNKLLKLVNSAFYGLAAGKVTTVTRAVVVLGYEHIRLATLSLALFEHFKSKSHTAHLKEAVVSSFWSGVLARDIAKMEADVDSEEAFVCAMMSQLGKLVMIYYLPDEYRKVDDWIKAHGPNEAKAVKAACGVTYEALGVAVARQWNFPDQISSCLEPLTNDDLKEKKKPPKKLRVLSSFVRDLTHLIQNGTGSGSDGAYQDLLDRYQNRIKLSKSHLKTLIKDSVDKVQQHAHALNFIVNDSFFMERLSSAFQPIRQKTVQVNITGNPDQIGESYQLMDDSHLKTSNSANVPLNPKDIIVEGIQEISQTMMTNYDVNDVALMSLEILFRAFRFHRALMFIREERGRKMTIRFGYGESCLHLTQKVQFDVKAAKDLFNLSIQTGKDLIVADAYDPKINHLIPSWYREKIDAPAFIFLPVMVKKVCIGAFYADRDENGQPIDDQEHRHLSMLRNQLTLAIQYRQGGR